MTASLVRRRLRVGHCILLLVVLLTWGAAFAARADATPTGFFGINAGREVLNDPVKRPAALLAMRLGGLSYVRSDAPWGDIEPAPPVGGQHRYSWDASDSFVGDLARQGLRWYPMLGYSAPWASAEGADPFAPPAQDADYAAYAAAVAARYGAGGRFWAQHPELPPLPTDVYGIWNEPDNTEFWHGVQATPARYVRLYLSGRAAIRGVDPGARVTTGGLLDSGQLDAAAFLRSMLIGSPELRGQLDAIDWHPYVGDAEAIMKSLQRARDTLAQFGLSGVPIEVSEVGWDGRVFIATQRSAELALVAAHLPSAGLGVERLLAYVWSGSPQWQITDSDGSPGAGVRAYFTAIRAAATPPPAVAPAPASTVHETAHAAGCATKRPAAANHPAARKRAALARGAAAVRPAPARRRAGTIKAKDASSCWRAPSRTAKAAKTAKATART